MSEIVVPFLAATVRTATPLVLASFGELLVERAGMINVGLEGVMLAGAFGGLLGATSNGLLGGYMGAVLDGVLVAAVYVVFVVWLEVNQIIVGTALTLLSVGLTGTLYRTMYGSSGAALQLTTSAPYPIPGLSAIPVLGVALFAQPPMTYFAYVLVPVVAWWIGHTHTGLALRAIGEQPEAARVAGVRVERIRALAVLVGGALGGLAGGTLVLVQVGTFVEGMTAGRGFIAIAIVVLGRWHPLGVAVAAFLFGAASALQFIFQSMGWHAPYQLFLAAPYLVTLAGVAGVAGRARAPAALGKAR